jgi:pyruvate dehydrogenase E1 component beta subunit
VKVGTVIALIGDGEGGAAAPAAAAPGCCARFGARCCGSRPGGAPGRPRDPAWHQHEDQTVREALRDAMAEEMRRDPRVFVMGEEVAEYQGAYKVTQGCWRNSAPSA